MNYMAELNVFYEKLQTRPLSTNAIALYGILMHLANRAYWPVTFVVAESTLVGMLGMSGRTMRRARAELVEAGIIKHLERPGRQAPVYKIVSLYTKKSLYAEDN